MIVRFQEAGVSLFVTDGQLRYRAPEGIITEKSKGELRAHKSELLQLLADKSYWTTLAGTKADPGDAWEEDDGLFLTFCKILREADSQEHLMARWNGQRRWFSENLSGAAMLALYDLFLSLSQQHGERER